MPSSAPKNKSSLPLLIVLLVLVIAGGGYYYYVNVIAPPSAPAPEVLTPINASIDWQKQLYNDPTYTTLQNPLPGPVEVGSMGNKKPFVQLAPSQARQ